MKNILKTIAALLICLAGNFAHAQAPASVKEEHGRVYLGNSKVKLGFDPGNGLFSLETGNGQKIIDNAYFQAGGLQSKDDCEKRAWTVEEINDTIGKGKALTVRITYKDYADILWQARLYDDQSFFIFNMGIDNDTHAPYQLMCFYPLSSKKVYPGLDNTVNYRILDGNGGGTPTRVTDTAILTSFNNMLVRFGGNDQPHILVAGGLTYYEFEKFIQVARAKDALHIQLYSEDPVGRRIEAGQRYWLNEQFYLCFDNRDPFTALEQYAQLLKKTQRIHLQYYEFPTECLWYAAFKTEKTRPKFNNSKGAVEEMDNAIKSGITQYTKVAIRLVPDAYGPNNQQGWWDDEHWAMYNEPMATEATHYTAPYLTTNSWCKAIRDRGGYPFTYMQSGRRSEDFVKAHPGWMLFNDPYRPYTGNRRILQESGYANRFSEDYYKHWWTDKQVWGYDFTDPGFIRHMQEVYARLKQAGIKGIFYDYPEATAWAYEGGFEDRHATTAYAYRQMFQLARDGLGADALLQERNIVRGSDIALGIISSQRVWGDTDGINPEMISMCGLRWYKNRTVINYDMDSKDPGGTSTAARRDVNRSMLTMCYVTSGRFLLGRSFSQLSREQVYDMSRAFPYHTSARSARPLDAFTMKGKFPRVYDLAIDSAWHQLTFYNCNTNAGDTIAVDLGKGPNEGGMGLDPGKEYYVYDFWNNRFAGKLPGTARLEQQLRPGEARMMSVHAVLGHPQFISTNRHLMQGYVDLKDCRWDPQRRTLSGSCNAVVNDTYRIVIAANGHKAVSCKASQGISTIRVIDEKAGIIELGIDVPRNATVTWSVKFGD